MSEVDLVFFDASVLVAAADSAGGGSAAAISMCEKGLYRAVLTSAVLFEARRSILRKFGQAELLRFYQLLGSLNPHIVAGPAGPDLDRAALLAGKKDAHVLAAALISGAAYLLTLDKRHLLTPAIRAVNPQVRVMTPGDFLQEVVP